MKNIHNPSGGDLELDYAAEAVFRAIPRASDSPITIRVFGGGEWSVQTSQFYAAVQKLNINNLLYRIENLSCDDVNVNHYSISYIVDWLLEGTVHWITAHIHQGIQLQIINSHKNTCFTMHETIRQLQRLKYHPGFPNGDQLMCPVFLQDKIKYLNILQDERMCNATYMVERPRSSSKGSNYTFSKIEIDRIVVFLHNCSDEGCGWVVKPPFVTCGTHFKVFQCQLKLLEHLEKFFVDDVDCIFPYTMIQPCMSNRKEYKVIYIPSKSIQYIISRTARCGSGVSYSVKPHTRLFDFVRRACNVFREHCPYAITDGLFRVDVFQTKLGELVVNEFESLDAAYYGGGRDISFHVTNFLFEYWLNLLTKIDIIQGLVRQSDDTAKESEASKDLAIRKSRKKRERRENGGITTVHKH